MPVAKVQLGQIWREDDTGDNWLVSKVYSEVFTTYAMLRKVGGGDDDLRRVKAGKASEGVTLPGFTLAQESGSF